MQQLQTCYAEQFGEQLPLAQYMSLYDNWKASNPKTLPTQPESTEDPKTVVLEATAGRQTCQHSTSCIKRNAVTSSYL